MSINYPLQYQGVRPVNPPNLTIQYFAPTVSDSQNFSIGDFWINRNQSLLPAQKEVYELVDLSGGQATWALIYPNGGVNSLQVITNSGTAMPIASQLNVLGSAPLTTTGAGNTVTIGLTDGTGNGQILMTAPGGPVWGSLTSAGLTVTITNPSAGVINLEAVGGGGGTTAFITDSGTANEVGGSINIFGDGTNITTSGSGQTVTTTLNTDPTLTGITLTGFSNGYLITTGGVVSSTTSPIGSLIGIKTVATQTYQVILADNGYMILFTYSSPPTNVAVTIPANATTAFPIGSAILFQQVGTSQVTVTPAIGVTIQAASNLYNTFAQYSVIGVIKTDVDTWSLSGDLDP